MNYKKYLEDQLQTSIEAADHKSVYYALLHLTKELCKEKTANQGTKKIYYISAEIIYVFLTIFLYLLKCPQSLILSALRAFCFCGKPHISRSIFLYFRYQAWLKSW